MKILIEEKPSLKEGLTDKDKVFKVLSDFVSENGQNGASLDEICNVVGQAFTKAFIDNDGWTASRGKEPKIFEQDLNDALELLKKAALKANK